MSDSVCPADCGRQCTRSSTKQSLPPDYLFLLALRGTAHLTQQDKQRLTPDDLTHLQMRGVV
jgi:hypothetical protein